MQEHRCPADAVHRAWDNGLSPALTVDSGDRIVFDTIDAGGGRIPIPPWAQSRPPVGDRGTRPTSVQSGHPLCGPIAVRGAEPGDVLEVRVLDVAPYDWGWTGTGAHGILGTGETPTLLHWDLRGEVAVPWVPEGHTAPPFRIPKRPFCGVMGTALAEPGEHRTAPPSGVGGNIDARRLTAGSRLFLPIAVSGALFSLGDVHAAQGDGEVCGTGIECCASVTVQLDLVRDRKISGPAYLTTAAPPVGPCHAVTGIGPDLFEAARDAVRAMIAHLQEEYGLEYGYAYILCSVAVDLTISEVVNGPNWVVSALLPLDVIA